MRNWLYYHNVQRSWFSRYMMDVFYALPTVEEEDPTVNFFFYSQESLRRKVRTHDPNAIISTLETYLVLLEGVFKEIFRSRIFTLVDRAYRQKYYQIQNLRSMFEDRRLYFKEIVSIADQIGYSDENSTLRYKASRMIETLAVIGAQLEKLAYHGAQKRKSFEEILSTYKGTDLLISAIETFDDQYVSFEQTYLCEMYPDELRVDRTLSNKFEAPQWISWILSEGLSYAIRNKLIAMEDIEYMEPSAILSCPKIGVYRLFTSDLSSLEPVRSLFDETHEIYTLKEELDSLKDHKRLLEALIDKSTLTESLSDQENELYFKICNLAHLLQKDNNLLYFKDLIGKTFSSVIVMEPMSLTQRLSFV